MGITNILEKEFSLFNSPITQGIRENCNSLSRMNNLLDAVEIPEQPSRASLTKQATALIGRRKTRRGKKKPKVKSAKWLKEFEKAKKDQQLMKKQQAQRAEMFKEFKRLISE